MKALLNQFTVDGFSFRQLNRAGDVALFKKMKPHFTQPSFEVVIVQRHPAETICGRDYTEREAMPPSESWGQIGWTFADREIARRKFFELCDKTPERGFSPSDTPNGESFREGRANRADISKRSRTP